MKKRITIRNILGVLQFLKRKIQKNWFGWDLPVHMQEQIIWRRVLVMFKSPRCWKEGVCKQCGCTILGKTMEDRGCSNIEDPCYPFMMKQKDWEEYKETNEIKLFL